MTPCLCAALRQAVASRDQDLRCGAPRDGAALYSALVAEAARPGGRGSPGRPGRDGRARRDDADPQPRLLQKSGWLAIRAGDRPQGEVGRDHRGGERKTGASPPGVVEGSGTDAPPCRTGPGTRSSRHCPMSRKPPSRKTSSGKPSNGPPVLARSACTGRGIQTSINSSVGAIDQSIEAINQGRPHEKGPRVARSRAIGPHHVPRGRGVGQTRTIRLATSGPGEPRRFIGAQAVASLAGQRCAHHRPNASLLARDACVRRLLITPLQSRHPVATLDSMESTHPCSMGIWA